MPTDNHIARLTDATEAYPAMLDAIAAARSSVWLANFCMQRGSAFDRFYEALLAAAKRGVAVKLLLDAYGSADNDPTQLQTLQAAGVEIVWFRPRRLAAIWYYNRRLHKKLLIVDGTVGFTGGIGVADFWIAPAQYPLAWRDTHFRVVGPMVAAMAQSFAQSWNEFSARPLKVRASVPNTTATNSVPRGALHSSPAEELLVGLITSATTELNLTTAYFSPTRRVVRALRAAAKRGVRVRVLANGPYGTHPHAIDAGRHGYTRLLASDVRIFEYQPTKIHAKITVADGAVSCIGSINLNFRSMHHDEEFNLTVRDGTLATQLNRDFERDLTNAHEIRLDAWKRRPIAARFQQAWSSTGRYFF